MLFSRIRNQGLARAETTRLIVSGALFLATWLALSAGCVHGLSGLPKALTARAAFDPASSRPFPDLEHALAIPGAHRSFNEAQGLGNIGELALEPLAPTRRLPGSSAP